MKQLRGMIVRIPALLSCLVLALGLAVLPSTADARVFVGIGIPFGVPFGWYGAPYFYAPPVYAYWPPAPVYVPPPVQYVVPPAVQAAPAVQYWYYCGKPKGYYPYVKACPGGWRQVQPKPVQ
jgi:hypothetical protein